jgi:hypothetical protein
MRKVSLKIIRYALFGVAALVLGACVKPVGIGDFLGDDKVQAIINGGITVNPGYEGPEDIPPKLSLGTSFLAEGDTVTVAIGKSVTITVTNAGDYDGGIEWFYDDKSYLDGGDFYTVNTTVTAPFNMKGTYQLAVKGTAGGKPYTTEIFIKVEE